MRVILPGSYDPVTLGHLWVIKEAAKKYGEVFAVAFINPDKNYSFTESERLRMLELATADIPGVRVDFSEGTVVDYMQKNGIEKIVKGYRNARDLEYERRQAEYNERRGGFVTELIKCPTEFEGISSSAARLAIESGAPLSDFLPKSVVEFIKNR